MTCSLVYFTDTGKADSIGTVLADPMPSQFTVRHLTEEEETGVLEGRIMWDAATLSFVPNPNWPPPPWPPDPPE
jgi:hypothetical protein